MKIQQQWTCTQQAQLSSAQPGGFTAVLHSWEIGQHSTSKTPFSMTKCALLHLKESTLESVTLVVKQEMLIY